MTLNPLRIPAARRLAFSFPTRPFSTTSLRTKLLGDSPQDASLPDPWDSLPATPNFRPDTQNTDYLSAASNQETLSGDNLSAQHPDHPAQPSRTQGTGGDEVVMGGKDGLGRTVDML